MSAMKIYNGNITMGRRQLADHIRPHHVIGKNIPFYTVTLSLLYSMKIVIICLTEGKAKNTFLKAIAGL